MVHFRNFQWIFLVFSLLFSSFQISAAHNKTYRDFWHPTFLGERVDYCFLDGKECGKPVADRYCQMLGYDYASQNVIAYNVGLTHYFGSKALCKGWHCNGFMTIGCATGIVHKPPQPYHYREKLFVRPRFNEYRVDWCYERARGCGAKAANSFCSRLGFMQAKRFTKEKNIGATKAIGSQELCFGEQCLGFDKIICSR